MFGMNIDPQAFAQMQQDSGSFMKECSEHPGCDGCKYYTMDGFENIHCENAIHKLRGDWN